VSELPEFIDGLPNICGSEQRIADAIRDRGTGPVFLPPGTTGFGEMNSAFANALHMHQPLIPAGGPDLRTAAIISNLKWMLDNPGIGDNHNAPVFLRCYKRMGEFVPQLLREGLAPRVMLEYSGTLLHGLRQMGADDVLDALAGITADSRSRQAVEWLGCPWGHAVAPSTPVQDFRLHVRAWQHHFAALFGLDALRRVRGFSPAEMALPNQPDVAYEFVKTLTDCGYEWVLVQEHTVEEPGGGALQRQHLPRRLVCTNSRGETASITAVVKTQGSDTKLVAQMQPYYEAKGLSRWDLAGRSVPPLVAQIADGENGGVMMNEFPPKYFEVIRECSGSQTPAVNVTEYLERLRSAGVGPEDLPVIQPLFQSRIWDRMSPGDGPDRLAEVIGQLQGEDGRFHMDGGSWTSDISWVRGYEKVLAPMDEASSLFHERVLAKAVPTSDPRYRDALFHLLTAETSCYRYWGEGIWTDYGAELARRTIDIVTHDL
jgi:Glycosyl hydrolase family 57